MIIDFTFKNYASFRDETSFSMLKSPERQHSDHVINTKYKVKLLPLAALYGANASGKSNFVKALASMQEKVVNNKGYIPPFHFDPKHREQATWFTIKIVCNAAIYEYSFSILQNIIQHEYLKKINSVEEILLFERRNEEIDLENIRDKENRKRLNINFEGTDKEQLFLNNVYFQNKKDTAAFKDFKAVYDWFNSELRIIQPNEIFTTNPFAEPIAEAMNQLASQFDLGFYKGETKREQITNNEIIEACKQFMYTNLSKKVISSYYNEIECPTGVEGVYIQKDKEDKYYKSSIALHYRTDKGETELPLSSASDGTKRLIQLLPALLMLMESNKVIVIDELDRSLHTLLARRFIELFLDSSSSQKGSQLIFTTHDVTLMDQTLFRRDELWIVSRSKHHASTLVSLIEYTDIRNDKDIRKSYLNGRFGGIPKILL